MIRLLETYGAWIVAGLIGLESMGIPVPGETSLVTSAVFAGTSPDLSIWAILLAGVVGAVAGNLVGFWIGRVFGYPLLLRYGSYVRITESRLKIGQYLFRRYGVAVVVAARFLPVLRSIASLLAGANGMEAGCFLLGSVIGALIWVPAVAIPAYLFGEELKHLSTPVMIAVVVAAAIAAAVGLVMIARNERHLATAAEKEFPGPLPRHLGRRGDHEAGR